MANHPNRNWKRRWRVDLAQRTATHESGLVVQFAAEPDEEGGIDGQIIAGMPDLSRSADVAQTQAQRIARLLREAGEIYQRELSKPRLP